MQIGFSSFQWNFSNILHEATAKFSLKVDPSDVLGENLFLRFSSEKGANWAKMRFTKFYENLTIRIFLIFYIKLPYGKILF